MFDQSRDPANARSRTIDGTSKKNSEIPKIPSNILHNPNQKPKNETKFRKFLQTLLKIPIRILKKEQKFLQTFVKIPIQNQTDWHCLVLVIIKTKMDPTRIFYILQENAELLQDFQESNMTQMKPKAISKF